MYLEIQYTIADLRPLIGYRKNIQKEVILPMKSLHEENLKDESRFRFLRAIGGSVDNRNVCHIPLELEKYRCKAKRAFRLPAFSKHELLVNEIPIMRCQSPYDRVYKDLFRNTYGVVNRFLWGFHFDILYHEMTGSHLKKELFNRLIEGLIEFPVKMTLSEGRDASLNMDDLLLGKIEKCIFSNKQKETFKLYLEATPSVIIFQLQSIELQNVTFPKHTEPIKRYKNLGIDLYKYVYKKKEKKIGDVFFIVTTKPQSAEAKIMTKSLRITLARLVSEKNCMLSVIRNKGYLKIDKIKAYLDTQLNNDGVVKTLKALKLDSNCNGIITSDERVFIEKEAHIILAKEAREKSPLSLLT